MSSHNRITFDGLSELKEALKNLPAELTREASEIVKANANKATTEIIGAYVQRSTGLHPGPRRKSPWFAPGTLKKRIKVTQANGTFSTSAVVKNTAPHAWLYDNGSQARHSAIGARGSMPAKHTFVKTVIRRRRIMYEVLKEMLVKAGLLVSGDA